MLRQQRLQARPKVHRGGPPLETRADVAMPDRNTDFTYVSVLRELEKEVAACAGKEAPKAGADLTRTNAWFKGIGNLLSFATSKIAGGGKTIAKKLSVTEEAIKKAEAARLRHLSAWTQSQSRYEIGRPTAWPPLIPIGLTVERFIGTTIGLHSEAPEEPFERHIRCSLGDAVAPAIAWGIWCQFRTLPEDSRMAAEGAIKSSIVSPVNLGADAGTLWHGGTAFEVPYLRLLHGWTKVLLQPQAEWTISAEAVQDFKSEVVSQFDKFCKDPNSGLSELLLRHYGATDQGSERARVVAMVQRRSPNSAAFLRGRLSLLSGAQLPGVATFRHLALTNLREALADAVAFLADGQEKPEDFGELACGRAYWLARVTYGKHAAKGILEEKASTLTLQLLEKAASHFKGDAEKRTYCLRFAAGYATNPRYFRSEHVLKNQLELINAYEREPLHRPGLAAMFRARVAWQCQASSKGKKNTREAKLAAKNYTQALDDSMGPRKGLDSEAPVHLFPELYVFLSTFSDDSAGSKKVLGVIDHVVQHNFGVYFDAPTEERLIKAGIEQFRSWHEANSSGISPEEALRGLAIAKGKGDYTSHTVMERKVRDSNAAKEPEEEHE